ncbi:hypothetical protein CHU98_g1369 [Xylaria longipes]|nr:hypothetical protein CHU98_g1369 [Xylaria longipes]
MKPPTPRDERDFNFRTQSIMYVYALSTQIYSLVDSHMGPSVDGVIEAEVDAIAPLTPTRSTREEIDQPSL